METKKLVVYLRPKTGFDYGKMYCEMLDDYFIVATKKEALLQGTNAYKVYYKDIAKIEDKNYMFIKGIQINFNKDVIFPSSPSLVVGGLLGGLIGLLKRKQYVLYFDDANARQSFIEKCVNSNNLIRVNN